MERMSATTCYRCGAFLGYAYRYCSRCGAAQFTTTPGAKAYVPRAYDPSAPGKASNQPVVIVVLAIVLLGLASGTLGYFLLQGSLEPPPRPAVTFGAPIIMGSTVQIPVARVTVAVAPSNYRVDVALGGSFGSPVSVPAFGGSYAYISIEGMTFGVSWIDTNPGGTVDAGDSFVIEVIYGFLPCPAAFISFYVLRQDESIAGQVSFDWSCESRPVIVFGIPYAMAGREIITIANASRDFAPYDYDVGLEVNVTSGVTLPMPTASGSLVTLPIYGYPYVFTLTWTDIGGDGTVNGGDSFAIGYAGGALPGNTSYTFSVLWQRVSLAGNTTWFTT